TNDEDDPRYTPWNGGCCTQQVVPIDRFTADHAPQRYRDKKNIDDGGIHGYEKRTPDGRTHGRALDLNHQYAIFAPCLEATRVTLTGAADPRNQFSNSSG